MSDQTFTQDEFCHNIKKHQNWSRLLYMLIFGLLLNIAGALMWVLAAMQFIFVLVSGADNRQLREFSASLAEVVREALLFVSFNTDRKPFPFAEWPRPHSTVDEDITPQTPSNEQHPH